MLLEEGDTVCEVDEINCFHREVYPVKHKFLHRQAIKVFKQLGTLLEEVEEMLREEAILSRFIHPNTVLVFDAGIFKTRLGQCSFSRWRT
jgi:eukaryotic-like serine/threonine-protein kinase